MQTVSALLVILSLLASLFVMPMYISHLRRFLDRLREEHQAVWLTLGGPALVLGRTGQNSKLQNYIVKRGYLALQDGELVKLGNQTQWYLFATLGLFALVFVPLLTIALMKS